MKRMLFAVVAVTLTVALCLGVLVAADLYEHRKMAQYGGLNVRGYRGPVVGRKKAGERRVVVVGESTAFGYGVRWEESFPKYLQDVLVQQNPLSGRPVSVVNLAYNNEGAHSYKFTLADYTYLDYDAVVFYSGYNDLGSNYNVFRHGSPIFRTFGYMPILPLVLHEKALMLQYGGRLDDAYRGKAVIFRPNAAQQAAASVLHAMSNTMDSIERPVTSEGMVSDVGEVRDGEGCGPHWAQYCGAIYQAVKFALDRQKHVLITTQPSLGKEHMDQQDRLIRFLHERFADNPRLHFVDLRDAIVLRENSPLLLDHMHLTADGNRIIAERLAKPVSDMLQ